VFEGASVPFTVQKLTAAPLMVALVTVADVIELPAPPMSVISIEASLEQSTTGATTASALVVAVVAAEPTLPLPQAATMAAVTQMANTASSEPVRARARAISPRGCRVFILISLR
jgi:hypothetical protein